MKKKALTLAIAAALSAPASFAATDQSGMRYTSAAEGLYGFVNMRIDTKSTKAKGEAGNKAGFSNSDTAVRLGVRGTNDMGHGLEGFYRWEIERSANDGSSAGVDNRLGNAGVRGAFGEVVLGSFWTADLNWIGAITDTAGADTYYTDEREGRSQEAIQYTTPDLNGFAGAVRFSMSDRGNPDETLNLWNLAAKYEVAGFHVGASYNVIPDRATSRVACTTANHVQVEPAVIAGTSAGTICAASATATSGTSGSSVTATTKDTKSWNLGLKYAQDNWFVGGVYGVDSTSDDNLGIARGDGVTDGDGVKTTRKGCGALSTAGKCEDTKRLGIAAGVTLDKISLSASWQKDEMPDGAEDTTGGIEAVYNFSSQARVLANYRIVDRDTNDNAENHLRLELRHSF